MGAPSIKIRMMGNFRDKISLMGCKWSNSNAPSTETAVSHQFLGESLFLIFSSGVIRSPQYKDQMMENFRDKISLMGCKWSNSIAPSTETPLFHPFFGLIPFSHFQLWDNKKWEPPKKDQDDGKF